MRILGVDTTRKIARIFVSDSEKEYHVEVDENIKHSEGLFLYIEKALTNAKITLDEIDLFSAIVGPGSFTGIRVGMSVIKGFCKALKKQVVGINTFELLAETIKNGILLLNSTSSACYYAEFKSKNIENAGMVDKKKIEEFTNGKKVFILKEEQNSIGVEYNNIEIIDQIWTHYIPAVLKKSKDDNKFEPFYLQLSQAERNLKND